MHIAPRAEIHSVPEHPTITSLGKRLTISEPNQVHSQRIEEYSSNLGLRPAIRNDSPEITPYTGAQDIRRRNRKPAINCGVLPNLTSGAIRNYPGY
jgi:hypothetical protein